jgi:photosystem II stability/assembly factor-like uncharacterized protein
MNLRKTKVFLAAFLISSIGIFAGQAQWTSNGPYGAHVRSLLFHPTRANEVLLVSGGERGILFRSRNFGKTWSRLATPDDLDFVMVNPSFPSHIKALSLHSFGMLYVYESTDNGTTWQNISHTEMLPHIPFSRFRDFKVSPSTPDTFYVYISDAGVFKSTDAGLSWSRTMNGIPKDLGDARLEVDPKDPNIVYLADGHQRVFKTTNGGVSWKRSDAGIKRSKNYFRISIRLHTLSPNTIYVGGESLYRSTNGGSSWQNVMSPCGDIQQIELDPKKSDVIYLACMNDAFKSKDRGASWQKMPVPPSALSGATQFKANAKKPNVLMLGGLYDLARSINSGLSWQTNVDGIDDEAIGRLYSSAKPTPIVIAETTVTFKKIFGNTNGKWSRLLLSRAYGPNQSAFSIGQAAINSNDSRFIVAGNDSSSPILAISRDQGRNWNFIEAPDYYSVELDPKNIGTVYLTSPAKSTNFGESWNFLNFKFPVTLQLLRIDPKNTSKIYGVADVALFGSDNAGKTWKKRSTVDPRNGFISDIQIDPEAPEIVYAAGSGRIFKSIDSGKTWSAMNQGLPDSSLRFVTINPFNHLNLFTGSGSNEFFVSYDGAMTWNHFDTSGLNVSAINHVIVDPKNPARLFVATDRGVFSNSP